MKADDMVVGKRYKVIHQIEGVQRYPRVSVMSYLGKDGSGEYGFNARPVAGTQSLPGSMILSIVEVPQDTPISLNRDARRS